MVGVKQTTQFRRVNAAGIHISTVTLPAGNYAGWFSGQGSTATEDIRFGRYTDGLTAQIDAVVHATDSLLPVWAAGNDRGDAVETGTHFEFSTIYDDLVVTSAIQRGADGGANGYDSMPPDSCAKNILTVGSVDDVAGGFDSGATPVMSSFSSYGPTDDLRIKPDVCANGDSVYGAAYDDPENNGDDEYRFYSGTSEAAPTVTGLAGLLGELFQRTRGDFYRPPASMLKGLIIHTADDILNAGPDYQSGWGLVNGESAANLVEMNDHTHQGQNVRMVTVNNGETLTIPVTAIGGEPLKVTVCSTDPAGTETTGGINDNLRMLVNDFQLRVTSDGQTFHPFVMNASNPAALATTGINDRDNVEQVLIASPVASQQYEIVLSPAAGETFVDEDGNPAPQDVAVVISGIESNPSLELEISSVVRTDVDEFTVVWPALVGAVYQIQESDDLVTFSDLGGEVTAQTSLVALPITSDPSLEGNKFWRVKRIK